jgi:ABC-2 type transport system ATP-binding protein
VRALVAELRGEGRTILLATHDLAEAESLCDRISLIDRGRLLATETPQGLRALTAAHHRIEIEGATVGLLEAVRGLPGVREVVAGPDGSARVEIVDAAASGAVLDRLAAGGATQIRMGPPSLEDVYVEIVGDRGLDI